MNSLHTKNLDHPTNSLTPEVQYPKPNPSPCGSAAQHRETTDSLLSLSPASPFPHRCQRHHWAKPRSAAAAGISLVAALEWNGGTRSSSLAAVVQAGWAIVPRH
jgi:hypothetical protein